jgi:hypothetical protein
MNEPAPRAAQSLPNCPNCGEGMHAADRYALNPIKPPSFACRPCGLTVIGYDRAPLG